MAGLSKHCVQSSPVDDKVTGPIKVMETAADKNFSSDDVNYTTPSISFSSPNTLRVVVFISILLRDILLHICTCSNGASDAPDAHRSLLTMMTAAYTRLLWEQDFGQTGHSSFFCV